MSQHWLDALMSQGFGTLFGKELRVLVQPNKIELNLYERDFKGGFQFRRIKHNTINFSEQDNACHLNNDALEKLTKVISNKDWHAAKVYIVLSNSFVRYSVLPWRPEITDKAERDAYLQFTFKQNFGDLIKHWHLALHNAGFGKSSLASAIEYELLNQLKTVFQSAQMSIKGIYPLLMLATNQALSFLKINGLSDSFWISCVENQRLNALLVKDGGVVKVWNQHLPNEDSEHIQTFLLRELMLSEDAKLFPILHYGHQEISLNKVNVLNPLKNTKKRKTSYFEELKRVA